MLVLDVLKKGVGHLGMLVRLVAKKYRLREVPKSTDLGSALGHPLVQGSQNLRTVDGSSGACASLMTRTEPLDQLGNRTRLARIKRKRCTGFPELVKGKS